MVVVVAVMVEVVVVVAMITRSNGSLTFHPVPGVGGVPWAVHDGHQPRSLCAIDL